MGTLYKQLSLEDRCEIARLQANGLSIRQIAAALDRAPSTISRELKRNNAKTLGYKPSYANQISHARRWTGSRLERHQGLRTTVLNALANGWSPEQVAGRLAREAGAQVISYESIYRFIHAQIIRTRDYSWRLYLPRAKYKRGWRGRKGGSSTIFIKDRVSISQRPENINGRNTPGHWEADLILFAKHGQVILAVHDRRSRIMLATRRTNKKASPIARQLLDFFTPMPASLRKTITFDNGAEFARHSHLHSIQMKTYFCDPHAPWQKGGIENAIGRMRRTIPRKTDLATVSRKHFLKLLRAYNNTPRKCLDYQTPTEVFMEQLLHFKCESTTSPNR